MQQVISGETPFKALKNQFAIGPTQSGYQIAYSATKDGTFTLDEDAVVPAGENLVYLGAMTYGWYKCVGLTDEEVPIIL